MEISNPGKVMFPDIGLTKAELVGHYQAVWGLMEPFVRRSPLTLERYPNGIGSKGFRQKNASAHFPETIERIEVPKQGGTTTYPAVASVEGLAYLANQGTITFHPWTSRLPDLDHPDYLVLDLDPEQGDLAGVRSVAHTAREVLARFGLDSLLVASGSKGYHLWVSLTGTVSFEGVGRSARALAGLVASEDERATTEFIRDDRKGRVFVDWLRNRRGQSIAAPFSVRARPGAPVATPLPWQALAETEPDAWTVRDLSGRPDVDSPNAADLPVDAIDAAARSAGVDLDTPFDRFGRG